MSVFTVHIEVVGNDGQSKTKFARRMVEKAGGAVRHAGYFGRGPSGSPVIAVTYEADQPVDVA